MLQHLLLGRRATEEGSCLVSPRMIPDLALCWEMRWTVWEMRCDASHLPVKHWAFDRDHPELFSSPLTLQLVAPPTIQDWNLCYQVQAHCTTSQWIQEKRHWSKKHNSIQKVRLMPWSGPLVGTWMPSSFIESEREKQWVIKVKRQNREGGAVRK